MNLSDFGTSLATNSTIFHATQECADWCSSYQQVFYHNQLIFLLMLPCAAFLILQALWLIEAYSEKLNIPQIKKEHPFYEHNIQIIRRMFHFLFRWMLLIYFLWIVYERFFGFLKPPPTMGI